MTNKLTADEKAAREHRRRIRPGQSARQDHDRKALRPGPRARLEYSRPPRIPSALNTDRRGYTAPGTTHKPKVRKGVGGRPVSIEREPRAFPVGRGPRKGEPSPANIRAAALHGDLALTVVTTPSAQVPPPVPGQQRRRDRRPALVAAAKAARRGAA